MAPRLARIVIYPVKSFDPVLLDQVKVLPNAALENDRRYALSDVSGNYVNGKHEPRVHRLRSIYTPEGMLYLRDQDARAFTPFHLDSQRAALQDWFGEYFGYPVHLIENREGGFPDDRDAPGPTLVSTASLQTVADWFRLSLDEVRRRFRANLEIDGVEPFWEDRLVGPVDQPVEFTLGRVQLLGSTVCQRCVVPSRDSQSAQAMPGFAKAFAQLRERALPDWAERSRFDHYYRLTVNTRRPLGSPASWLKVGDLLLSQSDPEV